MRPSDADLRQAIAGADLRVLLMVLFHLTGDRKWLEEPYRPKRDVRLIAAEDARLPPEIQAEIRAAAVECLSRAEIESAIRGRS